MIDLSAKISPHFRIGEFCQSDYGEIKPKRYQIYLIKRLAQDILEPIRERFGSPVVITSGIRNKHVWDGIARRARERGLPPPSKTTDHSYLDPEVNQWGVGAVDFFVEGVSSQHVFLWASENLAYGQIILYPDYHFIHISNPKEIVFSNRFAEKFLKGKKRKMLYKDGRYREWQKNI
jgi:hypothetical protein